MVSWRYSDFAFVRPPEPQMAEGGWERLPGPAAPERSSSFAEASVVEAVTCDVAPSAADAYMRGEGKIRAQPALRTMSSTLLIYTEHFGLRERPFTLLPDPDYLYWSEHHQLTYSMLEYGLLTHAPITLITGEIGAGKTTLIRQLLRNMPDDFTVGLISNAHGGRGELLHWVLLSLGQPVESAASYVHLFTQFQKYLIAEYAAGRRTVLIFDEAQNLSVETLEELRMFSNINADKDEVLQIILVGQPELRDTIKGPGLMQFAQRVSADFHLPAMSAEGMRNYISHRLQVAGAAREIFTPDACAAIHAASRGVPRVVNKICDHALAYAYSDGLSEVDAPLVAKVVADWKQLSVGPIAGEIPREENPPARPAQTNHDIKATILTLAGASETQRE
jgi:general secretion pathway protein A